MGFDESSLDTEYFTRGSDNQTSTQEKGNKEIEETYP